MPFRMLGVAPLTLPSLTTAISSGVRKVLAASFHSNSMFLVPIAVSPGPGHEADQNVLVHCRADSSLESPVMFAHAVSINRTHFLGNVILFQRRSGHGSVIVTAQGSGGTLYGGSNESVATFSVVVTLSNSPPRFSFRSIYPCSYVGNVGNVTVNMSTIFIPHICAIDRCGQGHCCAKNTEDEAAAAQKKDEARPKNAPWLGVMF